jgi:hypothetical protein
MYNSLIVARPALSAEINRLGLLAEPMPSLDAIAAHHNISLGGLPPLPFQKQEHSPGSILSSISIMPILHIPEVLIMSSFSLAFHFSLIVCPPC